MPHPKIFEHEGRLEIISPMRNSMRVLLAVLALFPLLAPYDLLIRLEWEYYLHPFFFLAALVSAGAVSLSVFLLFASIAGLSSMMMFERSTATFIYSEKAPLTKWIRRTHALTDISVVALGVREWSDSAPTYHLEVIMSDSTKFESGASWSRNEIESIQDRVRQFLASNDASSSAF
jgi:hypothetical protein